MIHSRFPDFGRSSVTHDGLRQRYIRERLKRRFSCRPGPACGAERTRSLSL